MKRIFLKTEVSSRVCVALPVNLIKDHDEAWNDAIIIMKCSQEYPGSLWTNTRSVSKSISVPLGTSVDDPMYSGLFIGKRSRPTYLNLSNKTGGNFLLLPKIGILSFCVVNSQEENKKRSQDLIKRVKCIFKKQTQLSEEESKMAELVKCVY